MTMVKMLTDFHPLDWKTFLKQKRRLQSIYFVYILTYTFEIYTSKSMFLLFSVLYSLS